MPLCCKALIALPGPSDSTLLSFVFQSTPSIAGCIMKLFEFCLHYSHDQTYKPKSVDMVHQAFCCCCCCEELGSRIETTLEQCLYNDKWCRLYKHYYIRVYELSKAVHPTCAVDQVIGNYPNSQCPCIEILLADAQKACVHNVHEFI